MSNRTKKMLKTVGGYILLAVIASVISIELLYGMSDPVSLVVK